MKWAKTLLFAMAALPAAAAHAEDKTTYNQHTLCAAATDMLRDVSSDNPPKAAHYARESKRNYDQALAVLAARGVAADKSKEIVDDLFARGTKLFQEDIAGSFTPMLGTCKNLGLIKMWEQ
jgi:hypothetical protein